MAAAGADIIDVGGESTRPRRAADLAGRGAGAHPAGDPRARRGGRARLRRYPPRRDHGGGAGCRRRASSTTSHALAHDPAAAAAGRRARLPGRADAHARHAGRHVRPGPLRRCRGRRDARAWPSGSRPPSAPASPRDRIAIDPGIGFAKTADTVGGAAAPPAGTCCDSAVRSWSASPANRSSARSPASRTRAAACPARWPPGCSRCRAAPRSCACTTWLKRCRR